MDKPDAIFNVAQVIEELVRQMGLYFIDTIWNSVFLRFWTQSMEKLQKFLYMLTGEHSK